jgi:hypothetical protein
VTKSIPYVLTVCGNEELSISEETSFDKLVFRPNAESYIGSGSNTETIAGES